MRKRSKLREFALQVLYQLDITKQDDLRELDQLEDHFAQGIENIEFVKEIVQGVMKYRNQIDQLIEQYAEHWRLDRMTIVDRNILRMAIFELLYCPEIPPKVTLNEAIDLGKRYGSEESGSFINGILDQIQNQAVRKPLQPKIVSNSKRKI